MSKAGDTLIDFAVGKAGDLHKWKESGLSFVYGIDISRDNIENPANGACTRYVNFARENTKKMERYTAELLAKTKRLDFIFDVLRKIQDQPSE